MAEATVEVRVPASLLRLGLDEREIQNRITEWLVFSLFVEGRISSGKAARLLDLTRVEFLNLLRRRGISYIDYTAEELAEELAAVAELNIGTEANT